MEGEGNYYKESNTVSNKPERDLSTTLEAERKEAYKALDNSLEIPLDGKYRLVSVLADVKPVEYISIGTTKDKKEQETRNIEKLLDQLGLKYRRDDIPDDLTFLVHHGETIYKLFKDEEYADQETDELSSSTLQEQIQEERRIKTFFEKHCPKSEARFRDEFHYFSKDSYSDSEEPEDDLSIESETEQERQAYETLDNFSEMANSSKHRLAGVLGDIKPVGEIDIHNNEQAIANIEKLLDQFGLKYYKEESSHTVMYHVSKSEDLLQRMRHATDLYKQEKQEYVVQKSDGGYSIHPHGLGETQEYATREMGRLYGFPETAIEFFIKRTRGEVEYDVDLPAKYMTGGYIHSPENAEEEYQQYEKKINSFFRRHCPKSWRDYKEELLEEQYGDDYRYKGIKSDLEKLKEQDENNVIFNRKKAVWKEIT
ncbi:hypothetical protein J6Z48_02035 [bacterium]|nr:hypothetical protein [bacterium]